MARQYPLDQGLHIIETSQSHSDTQHAVGLLCTSDQPDAAAAHYTHSANGRIRSRSPSNRAAVTHALDSAAIRTGSL